MFDKITGSEPRVVKTPGALLAVRGTAFDVDVDTAGHTTVDVFEGVVEVRSDLLRQPMLVHPGEETTFGRREPPSAPRPMPEDHRRNDPTRDPNHGEPHGVPPHGEGHQPPPPSNKPPSPAPGGHH